MDKAIREKLENFSVEPPEHVWSGIHETIIRQRRKRRMAYVAWTAAAAVVVFAFIAGWMLNEKSGTITKTLVEEKTSVPAEQKSTVLTEEQNTDVSTEQVEEPKLTANDVPVITAKNESIAKYAVDSKNVTATKEQAAERYNYRLLASRTNVVFERKDVALAEVKYKVEPSVNALSESDYMLIAENISSKNFNDDNENGWVVGAHVSPGYSAHSSNYSGQYAQNLNQVSEGGVSNVGGGISVQYKSNKRLSIESGIYYAQNSQSEKSSGLAYGPSMDFSASPQASVADAPSYSNAIRVSREGLAMNSTAGVVNLSNAPKGAEISTLNSAFGNKYRTTLLADGEFSQEFDLVEIPLYLRYKLIDKKFGVDIMGGLNAGLVVGNNAYIENSYGKQNVGETEDISTLNVSGTIGFGVNYGLGKHLSLALEPRFNYYLNSINSNPEVDYKPYRIGLFTGVYYAF